MKPQAVFVETNWVVDIVAPAHLQSVQAAQLLSFAETGEFELHLPAICLTEARETIPRRFNPRTDSEDCFCELDSDLQPWDKNGVLKPILSDLYNASRIWVYRDFLVEDVDELPEVWFSSN